MITVLEAARRLGRDPETVRRWIRAGKLPAKKIGLQHMIDAASLKPATRRSLPATWRRTMTGEPMPDVVAAIDWVRSGR